MGGIAGLVDVYTWRGARQRLMRMASLTRTNDC
jgi:hypothetical protein